MSKFENLKTGVVVSVDDEKDGRFTSGWKLVGSGAKSETPDKSWKVAELKDFATEYGIDLGEATKKDDIIAAIAAELGDDPDDDSE